MKCSAGISEVHGLFDIINRWTVICDFTPYFIMGIAIDIGIFILLLMGHKMQKEN